ncbi:hypothetical protein cypCar_00011518 [Cyprinus carpio]|nr:hypothetical protein cypCar_00011518 [Cyprinus carpio]
MDWSGRVTFVDYCDVFISCFGLLNISTAPISTARASIAKLYMLAQSNACEDTLHNNGENRKLESVLDGISSLFESSVIHQWLPGLQPWTPGHNEAHRVTIGYGRKVVLTSSATVHSIEILNGGKLVIADSSRPIFLRAKHILIGNKGELHIGSPECPYKGNLTISLFGRSDDSEVEHSYFGRKYIGVGTGGTLEIHGQKKLSWTFLNKTLHPGQGNENSYRFERSWGKRGIITHVINPKTGDVLHTDRFDTYRSKDESRRLAQYVDKVETGQILAMVVNDEGSNNLEDLAKKALTKLGSQHFQRLGFRYDDPFPT